MAKDFLTQTTVEIVGAGKRMRGFSEKTKKTYDFQEVSFTFPHNWMDGVRADTDTIQGADLDKVGCAGEGCKPGDVFDAWVQIDQYKNAKIAALVARA